MGKATVVFQQMVSIWTMSAINTATKIRLFNAIIIPTTIYASETWKSITGIIHKINVSQKRCFRRILRISYQDHVTNKEILQ